MNKSLVIAIAFIFSSGPALASNFEVIQIQMLDVVASYMKHYRGDEQKMSFLSKRKQCMEGAVDIEDIKQCLSKYPTSKMLAQAN